MLSALAGNSLRDGRLSELAVLRAMWLEGSAKERQRIDRIRQNWAFYNNEILPARERGETEDHYARRVKLLVNLLKRTVKIKRNLLYATGVKAEIKPASVRKPLEEIWDANRMHKLRLRLATQAMVSGTGVIQPVWMPDGEGSGQIKYRLIGADNVVAIMDPLSPEEIRELRIYSTFWEPDGETMHAKVEVVTAATWRVFVDDKHRPDLEADGGANPYGFLPFVFFRNSEDAEKPWGGDEVTDLVSMQNEFNCRASDASNVVKHHGSPVLVGKNIKGDVTVGPDRMVELQGDDAGLEYLTWSQDMPGAVKLMDRMVDWFATVSEIPSPELMNLEGLGNLTSGRAIRLLYAMAIRGTHERQIIYGAHEEDLAKATVRVLNVHTNGKLPEDVRLTIRWPTDLVPVDEVTKLETQQMRRDLGFDTWQQQLAEEYPDWTEKQIEEHMAAVMAEREARVRAISATMTPRENMEIERVIEEAERAAETEAGL